MARPSPQFGVSADLQQAAFVQHRHTIRHRNRFLPIMRDVDPSGPRQLLNPL
jgi:hypothetical protein